MRKSGRFHDFALTVLAVGLLTITAAPSALAQSGREAALEKRVEQLEGELKAMRQEMRQILAAVKKNAAAKPKTASNLPEKT